MRISKDELQRILDSGFFLADKGYIVSCNEYCVTYTKGIRSFRILFEPYSDISSVSIFFKDNNEEFNIGWIAFVRENINANPRKRLDNIIILLDYINNHYEDITNYQFCKESEILVKEFISKK